MTEIVSSYFFKIFVPFLFFTPVSRIYKLNVINHLLKYKYNINSHAFC